MPKIVPIVEGYGDTEAVPILLRRILQRFQRYDVTVARPKNAHGKNNLTKANGLERFVTLASLEEGCGSILVLVDADEACATEIARDFSRRILAIGPKMSVVSVVAKCEYESWFLAGITSLAGRSLCGGAGLPKSLTFPGDVESKPGAKAWITRHLPRGRTYKETVDQAALTGMLDIELAEQKSRSLRRFTHAVEELVASIDSGAVVVTPIVL